LPLLNVEETFTFEPEKSTNVDLHAILALFGNDDREDGMTSKKG
jgi:hypothetical protein